jgi:hypothetical protein
MTGVSPWPSLEGANDRFLDIFLPFFLLFFEMEPCRWCLEVNSLLLLLCEWVIREETRKERPLDLSVLHNLVSSFLFLQGVRTFYYLGAAPCVFADPSGLVPPLAEAAIYGVQRLISACSDLKGLDCFFATNYRVFLFRD